MSYRPVSKWVILRKAVLHLPRVNGPAQQEIGKMARSARCDTANRHPKWGCVLVLRREQSGLRRGSERSRED